MLGFTKTLNVDIWNFWFPAFLGLIANAVSGSVWVGFLGIVVALMIQWLLADIFQERISKFFGYPGIAITHMMALCGVIFAIPVNWLFDHIPVSYTHLKLCCRGLFIFRIKSNEQYLLETKINREK